jgi:hypothetical protein
MKSEPMQAQRPAQHPGAARWPMQTIVAPRVLALATLSTVVALSTLVSACRPRSVDNASPSQTFTDGNFRWTLTRLEGASPERQVGWLDNETILFIGSNDSYGGTPEISGLYAWNRKGPARLVLPHAYRFCFDGKTWSTRTEERQAGNSELTHQRYRLNPLSLSIAKLEPKEAEPSNGFANPYTCKKEKHPQTLIGHYWEPLRPQDGYVDFGKVGSRNQEAVLIRPKHQTLTPLAIKMEEPIGAYVTFSSFRSGYIIYNLGLTTEALKGWQSNGSFPVYLLQSSGRVRRINVGTGPWSAPLTGDRSFELSIRGIVVSSKAGSRLKDTPSGIYLARNNNDFTKLAKGIANNLSISPDGCGLAYSQSEPGRKDRLLYINLCTSPDLSNHEANQ